MDDLMQVLMAFNLFDYRRVCQGVCADVAASVKQNGDVGKLTILLDKKLSFVLAFCYGYLQPTH